MLERVSIRACCILGLLLAPTVSAFSAEPAAVDFERDAAPILINHCLECHQPDKRSGGLDLSARDGLLTGGDSGPAIEPGSAAASYLIERVTNGEMPPQEEDAINKAPLSKEQIAILAKWIESGAQWPEGRRLELHEQSIDLEEGRDYWAFQPIVRPPIPEVKHPSRVANPIDAFVWKKLEEVELEMAPPAERAAWLRRIYLDVLGLPPTIEEQQAFLHDDSPDAFERVASDLLSRPGYGERWARHWLDLARYADTNGYERDGDKPSVWRYRDYVIDSLNADKPYDRFVLEQLAGDELAGANAETLTALGFYALGTWQDEVDPLEQPQYRADELDDLIRTTANTFLGITIGCARCHNHKFDPLSMVDYYSLSAILAPLNRPNEGRTDRDLPIGTRSELAAQAQRDDQVDALRERIKQLQQSQAAGGGAAEEAREQASLEVAQLEEEIDALLAATPDLPRAYYLFEPGPQAPESFLLLRGRASNPGPQMAPLVPAVLTASQPEFPGPDERTSRRRITLAEWIVDEQNPLAARVIVNRVWQHHFGVGIVATPSDFGAVGARPTHPELLDWLAHWLMHDADWSLKRLHYLILTSNTYRASSVHENETCARVDPENRLLWRFGRRRLAAETIRDSMLAVSGELQREMHGPAVQTHIHPAAIEAHTDKQKAWSESSADQQARRTIYAKIKRTLLPPMLEVLDLCDTTRSSDKRAITNIAPQALTLYNGEFVNRQAELFAKRIERAAGDDPERQVETAWRIALCRAPSEEEQSAMIAFLADESKAIAAEKSIAAGEARRQALVQLCRVILNLNEFVFP